VGEIKRQSIISSLLLYLGLAFGFFNTMIVLPRALGQTYFGFYTFFMTIGTTLSLMTQMGIPNTVIRYFPYFKNEENRHNGFFGFIVMAPIIGTLIAIPFMLYFKTNFIEMIAGWNLGNNDAALIEKYYWLFLIFSFFVAYYNIFQSYSQSLLKSSFPIFIRQIYIKLGIAVLAFVLILDFIGLETFFYAIVLLFASQALLMLLFFLYHKQVSFKVDWSKFNPLKTDMTKFTVFSWLARSAPYLVDNVDKILITALAAGHLTDTGIYAPFAFAGGALASSGMAVNAITIPLIARAWKNNDLKEIASLYRKTAINLLVVGGLLFVGIAVNLDNMVSVLNYVSGEDYSAGKYVAVFVGLGFLFDLATGINGGIITNSKYYYYNLLLIMVLLVAVIITDIIFIPIYGLIGAAVATAGTRFFFNLGKMIFVKWKFDMQPFTKNTLLAVLVILVVLAMNLLIPRMENFFVDLIVRSGIVTVLYIGLTLLLKVSDDISNTAFGVLRRVGLMR